VFISHTSELREFPKEKSYVAAVERAISAAEHVIVDMADFPAADLPAAQLCAERVQSCDVYLGVLGTRYGSPVRDKPEVSYTELEFGIATQAGLPRLVFLLDTNADVGIPPSALIDREYGARQDAFRDRVRDSGLVTGSFASPAELGQVVERSLQKLAKKRQRTGTRSQRGQVPAVVVVGEIPREPPGFQPREDLLAGLDATGPRVSVVHAVTGMRGVGKTQLAAAYARARIDEGWRLVAWVNAEDAAVMLAGLAAVAEALGLDAGAGDVTAAGRAVRHRLEVDGDRCLLVLDNATDPQVVEPFLPAAGAAKLIITSNQRAVANLGAGVPVEVFTEPEALAFLAERTAEADAEGARGLAAELGRLPLALAQAAAVIADQHLSYGTYLDRLRRLPVGKMLAPVAAGQYPRGAAAAALLSLKAVQTGDETGACDAVMNLLAVLSAAGVRRSLLYEAGLPGRDGPLEGLGPEVVDRALARLAGASLLTFSLDGSAVSAHRLVMRVIRENLAATNTLTAVCETAAELLDAMAQSLRETWYQDRAAARDLVEQIMALDESSAGCGDGSSLERSMLGLRLWAIWLLNRLGDNVAQAVLIGERLVADSVQVLGPDHRDTLLSLNNLATAYQAAGRPDEAIPLLEQTLADRERILGPDHADTLASRSGLATGYQAAGRTDEAIPLHEQTLADQERILGPDHRDTLLSRNELGLAYQIAGRPDEAIPLHEQTLADYERIQGPYHPYTLTSRNNLGLAYKDAGRTGEAITLHEQNLADLEQMLGPGHPNTLMARNNLGLAYVAAGRTDEAITLHEQTLADQEQTLGPDHRDTLLSRNNLAAAYQAADRTGEAITLHEQNLADRERILGPDHPDTLASRSGLATAHRHAGRTDKAITLHEQNLADRERILGPDHPDTLQSRNSLAAAYRDAGRTDEAEELNCRPSDP
jgi:tetratricopeptide (TPR) repeat protein